MHSIHVKNFSCIKDACLELSRLTVLIGPQASGKSLLSKLVYFFNNIALEHRASEEIKKSIEDFRESIRIRFVEWFPVSAWGDEQFKIEYTLGNYSIKLSRTKYAGTLTDNIRILLSKDVEIFHKKAFDIRSRLSAKIGDESSEDAYWEMRHKIDEEVRLVFDRTLGNESLSSQLFIPAGRAFFTSAGKAITAFEHARMFDPVTLAFGKRLANYRDRGGFSRFIGSKQRQRTSPLTQASDILGGRVVVEKGAEFLRASDGRLVPFGSLSSGQQELLPLLMMLESVNTPLPRGRKRFVFIEEPEAHLFPAAQSRVIELFAAFAQQSAQNAILLTTHSPYVLSKINNLILAGQLGSKTNADIILATKQIVPAEFWLPPPTVSAYALQDGIAKNIIDSNKLIDAEYLDQVSGDIAREFNRLIEVEISQ
jgi:hypothetical protein